MSPVPDTVDETPLVEFDSCLQCGECSFVCPTNAVEMVGESIVIVPELCTNCGLCVEACPDALMATSEGERPDRALVVKEDCIGCSICEQSCPIDAIVMDPEGLDKGRGLAVIDSSVCDMCDTCAEVCPTDCIAIPQQYRRSYDDESILGEPLIQAP
ncbi:MAG: Polyferredoxin protein MvhB [Methanonatronarchaeales archaeon]|nr:Polyferredoxin protein MvhB [Methanonatronarchaeales archaeon]